MLSVALGHWWNSKKQKRLTPVLSQARRRSQDIIFLFQQWSRDRWWMYNKASHAAKRVELEPPGQVSLYLSPTLTAGPFCNICLRFHTELDDKVAPVLCHKYTLSCYSVKEMRLSGWMQMIQKGTRYSPALRSAALRCVIKCLCWVTLWSRTCYFTIWWELWPYKFNTSWIPPLIKKVSPHLESYSIRFWVSVCNFKLAQKCNLITEQPWPFPNCLFSFSIMFCM